MTRKEDKDRGFVILVMLLMSLVLFSLVSLAVSANYRLHRQNRRLLQDLQARADAISPTRPD